MLMRIDRGATDTPTTAGSINFKVCRTLESRRAAAGLVIFGKTPRRFRAANWVPNCSTPPPITATANAQTGSAIKGVSTKMQTMKLTFKSTGVKAGTAKCFHVFKTAAANATRLMKMMYGNMKRVSATARSNVSGCSAKPVAMSQMTAGAKITPAMLVKKTEMANSENTCEIKSFVRSGLSFSFTSDSIGRKACENAPSAKRRRKRFGIRNAT